MYMMDGNANILVYFNFFFIFNYKYELNKNKKIEIYRRNWRCVQTYSEAI